MKKNLPLSLGKDYAVLWGRQGRTAFAAEVLPALLPLALTYGCTPAGRLPTLGLAAGLWLVATALVAVLAIRRLHDLGRSGWYSLLLLVPGLNHVLLLVLLVWPGQAQATRHGTRSSGRLLLSGGLRQAGA